MKWNVTSRSGIPLLAAGAGLLMLAVAGSDLANGALRALAVASLIGAAGVALRSRRGAPGAPLVAVMERQVLGRETGIAVLAAEGRQLLVGYSPAGVTLLTEVTRAELVATKERLP